MRSTPYQSKSHHSGKLSNWSIRYPRIMGQYYLLALLFILLNRIGDGLDGAIARQTQTSDAGGFLDICLDFIFYA